jgi:hypothetical protein
MPRHTSPGPPPTASQPFMCLSTRSAATLLLSALIRSPHGHHMSHALSACRLPLVMRVRQPG